MQDDVKAVGRELRELLAKATPGPARKRGDFLALSVRHFGDSSQITHRYNADTIAILDDGYPEHEAVADLFVAAVNALPKLLDTLAALQERCERLEAEIAQLRARP